MNEENIQETDRTILINRLYELRRNALDKGMKLLSANEILEELERNRRGNLDVLDGEKYE